MAIETSQTPPEGSLGHSSTTHPDASAALDEFRYDDQIVRWFAGAALLWGLVATLIGLLVATLLVLPNLFAPLGDAAAYFSFARLRPVHTSTAIFAFAGNAVFAAVYYSTQRLCKARMWSGLLSWLHFLGWQAIIISSVTLPLGITQGREYAELEWPIDIALAVVWILFFGVNFFMTLARRRERHLYVTLWFYIATIVTVAVLQVFNNLSLAIDISKSYSIYAGVHDAMMQWWYGHNLIAFLLIMPFLGLMYYFVPKAAERPVFSYKLAIVHFWALVVFHLLAGPHHLHHTAAPEWASTFGMLFGILLWMPAWGGALNGLMTLRAARPKLSADPALKFFLVGVIFYGWYALDRTLVSVKTVNRLTHYTDWTIAHVHAGTLGWNGMMIFGMLYWLLPRLFQTKLWSTKLANWHFWIALLGVLLYIVPTYAAGLIQGWRWLALDEMGRLAYPGFLETVEVSVPLWWARVAAGAVFIAGILLMLLNYVMTWATRPAKYDVPVQTAVPLSHQSSPAETTERPSRLESAPVLDLAKRIDIWKRLNWHRRWERVPGKFTFWVATAVVVASLIELGPMFLARSEVPPTSSIQPYTPLELAGRDIYLAEGCYHCHSQTVRPLVAETARYGDYSQAEEFAYDHPAQWGSRRIGPDLHREGGKQTSLWHWLHLEDPQRFALASAGTLDPEQKPQSVMPSYEHLLDSELDFDKVTDRVWAAQKLGAEYDFELDEVPAIARNQAERIAADIVSQGGPVLVQRIDQEPLLVIDTQAVALIAYLQRLGVDIRQPAETSGTTATDSPPPADGAPASDEEPQQAEAEQAGSEQAGGEDEPT